MSMSEDTKLSIAIMACIAVVIAFVAIVIAVSVWHSTTSDNRTDRYIACVTGVPVDRSGMAVADPPAQGPVRSPAECKS
jgi:hypothetical protein